MNEVMIDSAPRSVSAASAGGREAGRRWLTRGRVRDLALVPAIALMAVIGAVSTPSFLSTDNLVNILNASAALALLVLAESLILLTGKFDLSLESTVGIAPALGFLVVIPKASAGFGTEWPAWAGMLLILLTGLAIGALNGFLVVRLRLSAFIVTLAMLIVLRGALVGLVKGKTLFDAPKVFFSLGSDTFLGVPLSVWVAALAFAVAGFLTRYHRLGRALYAIGGNPAAARAAGIPVDRIVFAVYVIAGALAALAGLLVTGRVGALNANQGDGMIFTVFAAAVIGGISLNGGRGSLVGALLGVLLLGTLDNVLTLAQVSSFWVQAIYGVILLVALVITRITTGEAQE